MPSTKQRRLVLCGALDVSEDLIQDVNKSVRQIVQAAHSFGTDEKHAARETIKDASHYVKDKITVALSCKNKSYGRTTRSTSSSSDGQTRQQQGVHTSSSEDTAQSKDNTGGSRVPWEVEIDENRTEWSDMRRLV